jgi:hypothetical protein
MFSVSVSTSALAVHKTLLNLSMTVFRLSHVFTSVQGSGVLSYEIALVPFTVVLFMLEQLAMFYIYDTVVVLVVVALHYISSHVMPALA